MVENFVARVCRRQTGQLNSRCDSRRGERLPKELSIELDREDDGRWIAEVIEHPGAMSYGSTREEAIMNAERLAIEVIADRIQHGELRRPRRNITFRVHLDPVAVQ